MRLSDCCIITMGQAPKSEFYNNDNGMPLLAGAGDFGDSTPVSNRFTSECTRINNVGDILLCIRATIGKKNWADKNYCLGRGVAALNVKDQNKTDIKYLWHWLTAINSNLNDKAKGATFKQITKNDIEELSLNLPPISEQHRIAAILDKADAICRKRKECVKMLYELVKARFVEMFGDIFNNEKSWNTIKLGDIADIYIGPFGTVLHKNDYISNGHYVINPSHIIENKIIPDNECSISHETYVKLKNYHLVKDDIILARRGEMGRCAVITESNMLCGTGCMIIRPNKLLKSHFIQLLLSHPFYKKILENKSVGITMQNLNTEILSNLDIYLFPQKLQDKYLKFILQINKIKSILQTQLKEAETLKAALMQQYFSVPQENKTCA